MAINLGLVLIAALVSFVLGAVWHSPIMFGKWWAQIMGMDKLSKDELQKLQKDMGPFYGLQFILALVTMHALANVLAWVPDMDPYTVALSLWAGFVVPIQIGSVIWGNTKKPFWAKQIFVMTMYQLVSILVAVTILGL